MRYKVTKQYGQGPETPCAEFADLNDAKLFIETKIQEDKILKVNVIYRIQEYGEAIETYDVNRMETSPPQGQFSQGSQGGKGSQASFRPTPLNTAPSPPGTPQKWLIDEDDDEDQGK